MIIAATAIIKVARTIGAKPSLILRSAILLFIFISVAIIPAKHFNISHVYGKQSIGFMKGTKKTEKNQWVLIGVSILVASLLIGFYVWPSLSSSGDNRLVGVLLDTGDIYFGKLSYFPKLTLSDVYTVQTGVDPEDPANPVYQIVPLEFSIWGPSKIVLNYDKVVFIGEVGEDSQVMQIINQQNNR